MNVIGIDPGLDGGLVLCEDGKIVESWVMPTITYTQKKTRKIKKNEENPNGAKTKTYEAKVRKIDIAKVCMFVNQFSSDVYNVDKVYLEMVSSRPDEGVSSSFNFGVSYGILLGVLTHAGIPYELVTPGVWAKAMCSGTPSGINPKDRSRLVVNRLFPKTSFVLKGCRKEHEGLVDAALIAYYGYCKEKNCAEN